MQAMARQQAASGAVARGGEDGNPFATLSVWRDKLQADLSALGVGGPDFKLRLLLEQVGGDGGGARELLTACH